jgi:O-antigen/teichoic acid export membrane protein
MKNNKTSSKSLKLNTIANFIGLFYTTIIGIIIFPLYIQYLGAEAFGLVGFFTVLQAWMHLMDMGMSPLLSRQAAFTRGQNNDFLGLKKLLRSLEIIVLILSLTIALIISANSDWIADNWLKITSLELSEVAFCISLMGAMIGLRFFVTLYRSGIQGMENQVRLNVANVVVVTLKFAGGLLLLRFVTQDFVYFFVYQLIIGIVELSIMVTVFYRLMPFTDKVGIRFYWNTLKPVLPFATGIAYTAGIWVLLTQLDKMILSTVLPLSEYGYFALVTVIAAGILKISGPVNQAILPRMTHLLSQDREQDMLILYRKSTQLMSVIMLPLTGMIAMFSTELIFAWTGDRKASEWAGPILFWFALGNGIMAIDVFQYFLQFAHGKLKMHVIFNTFSACIQVPVIVYVALEYGALGVAFTWFLLRLINFIFWTPFIHYKFAPGIHWPWLLKDIAPIFITTAVSLIFINNIGIDFNQTDRAKVFFVLMGVGLIVLIINILVSSECRKLIITAMSKA